MPWESEDFGRKEDRHGRKLEPGTLIPSTHSIAHPVMYIHSTGLVFRISSIVKAEDLNSPYISISYWPFPCSAFRCSFPTFLFSELHTLLMNSSIEYRISHTSLSPRTRAWQWQRRHSDSDSYKDDNASQTTEDEPPSLKHTHHHFHNVLRLQQLYLRLQLRFSSGNQWLVIIWDVARGFYG